VAPGEAAALLGRNGAGKSTTFRAILGLLKTRSGGVGFAGHDLTKLPTHEIVRLGLGYVPEDRRIFSDLTVAESLSVGRRAPRRKPSLCHRERRGALFRHNAAVRRGAGGARRLSRAMTKRRGYRLDDQVGFVLRQAQQRHTALFASLMIEGLTPTQWAALAKL